MALPKQLIVIILFISLITAGLALIYFPFSFYSGFILRHQFGLSTQTFAAWLRDFGVGFAVSLPITLLSFGGFYALMKLIPRRWPLWVGLAMVIFNFGLTLLQPLIITPLFYEITPVADSDLRRRIQTMTERAGVVIDDISVIDASSKTTTINAYFTGYGGASKIFLWITSYLNTHPMRLMW